MLVRYMEGQLSLFKKINSGRNLMSHEIKTISLPIKKIYSKNFLINNVINRYKTLSGNTSDIYFCDFDHPANNEQ